MATHLIIDGYNLIRRSSDLSALDDHDIQMGRDSLIDMLAAYKKMRPHKITVIFDGTNAPLFSQHRDQHKGILIKFSRNGETADSVIKRMAEREMERAVVVSSDNEIIHHALSRGCSVIGSKEFEQKLLMAEYGGLRAKKDDDNAGWIPTTKKRGPRRRLPRKKRRNRSRIKKL